ncbi:DUF4158 domain-containing protein [Nonomuraea polychroma]|uniref:DUF4158 domain-containing protein n=1 Tax=Nonomuraea polychroma TaxID=46176 RepID=UPI003D8BF701
MGLVGWGFCLIVFVSETVGGGRVRVRREREPEELIAAWTLLDGDWELVGNKTGATRLGFGLLLKFFEQKGRFPRHSGEVPKAAVDYVAGQVKVDPALFAEYR